MSDNDPLSPVAGDVPVAWDDGVPLLDLRAVDTPPKPLVAIIELIERPTTGNCVHLLMARDPVHLYPELVERGWSWSKEQPEDGVFFLILNREPDAPNGTSQ